MTSTAQLTLLHLSDMHFGNLDPVSGDAVDNLHILPTLLGMPFLDGLLGHQRQSLHKIQRFCRYPPAGVDMGNFRLVVSGDLSRVGASSELNNAFDYFAGTLSMGNAKMGLRRHGSQLVKISGNHDQWWGSGVSAIFGQSPVVGHYFNNPPHVSNEWMSNGRLMQVALIDTDADVHHHSLDRLMARGRFSRSQLPLLAAEFANQLQLAHTSPTAPKQWLRSHKPFRVLVMHHSPSYLNPIPPKALTIRKKCESALQKFLVDEDIRVILSGHTHIAALKKFFPSGSPTAVLECCCGSSSQLDQVPGDYINKIRKMHQLDPRKYPLSLIPYLLNYRWKINSFILHTAEALPGGDVRWKAQVYLLMRHGAEKDKTPGSQGVIVG